MLGVRKIYFILLLVMMTCIGCEWHLRKNQETADPTVAIDRYDRIEALYLTTGDVAALHQMNTDYPDQTRTLIEDLLQLGHVNDSDINVRFLQFFKDTTLQRLLVDVTVAYEDVSDLDQELSASFGRLQELLPQIQVPRVYTQIGSLDQSIVVGEGVLGISLDKYLGCDHPVYLKYGYSERQRSTMTRSYIVPDCLGFYLLSYYPIPQGASPDEIDEHMGRIKCVVNEAVGREVFTDDAVKKAERILKKHSLDSVEQFLKGQLN